ncbi:MAG: DNA polymerase I [Treponema sp.]|nr:DNA polymerase I [Treponema sp.]
MTQKPPLYLIDAYGLIYRSYFGFMKMPLRNRANQNVSALFGFARNIVSLLDEDAPAAKTPDGAAASPASKAKNAAEKIKLMAAVFDSLVPTFRHKMFDGYKANRQKAPEDLHAQVPMVEEFLSALKIPVLAVDGFEADDIIATLAEKCRTEKRQCYIFSSDKDLLQLVGSGIWEMRPTKNAKIEGTAKYEFAGADEVKAEWGVAPDRVLDLLSLTGDSSDNVPGVKGIGEVTAVKLMSRYGSLDGIYENIAGIEGAVGKKLIAGKESAYFSKSLIKLDSSVPLKIKDIEELSIAAPDRSAGAKVLLREGIRQIAKQLDPAAVSSETGAGADMSAAQNAEAPGESVSAGQASGDSKTSAAQTAASGAQTNQRNVKADAALIGEGKYKTILNIKELESLLSKARSQNLLSLDFETDSLDAWNAKPIGVSLAVKPKEAFYVPLSAHRGIREGDDTAAPFVDPGAVRELLAGIFSDPDMTVAAHNAKFDYKVSRGWGIERWKCSIWDTMIAAWIIDPEWNNYSLDSLSQFYFNLHPLAYNDIVPKGSTFDTVPLETACRYSAEDSDYCLRLMNHLDGCLANSNSTDLFLNLEMPLLPILAEMEGLGIKIDSGILKKYGVELGKELEKIQSETYRIVGHEFNLSSTQQLQKVLFEERRLTPGKKTKTGFSTDAEALGELAREDEVPALILRHRTLSKIKSTYVDALPAQADSAARLHTNFVQTGTATGRLSSREPNLQNIPIRDDEGRRIREAFIAGPGSVLVSADYSQIELVVLAHLSGDNNLIESFREGRDVHARTASLIFGIDEKKVTSEQRRIAKTINFGVMYGMSAFRLANELGISRSEAAAFIDTYFKTYSGVRAFIDGLIKKTEETGYAVTIMGRRRFIPAINSRNKTEKAAAERVAVNTPIQGSAADIVKTAMIKLDRALTAAESPAALLLQVHDELILECPKEAARETAALVQKEMENAVKLRIPLRVSVETGKCWGAFH